MSFQQKVLQLVLCCYNILHLETQQFRQVKLVFLQPNISVRGFYRHTWFPNEPKVFKRREKLSKIKEKMKEISGERIQREITPPWTSGEVQQEPELKRIGN